MRIRAPYRLEPRPGGYTVVVPRPCNDCEGSGIVAKTRRHYPPTYAHCDFCKGSGSAEALFLLYEERAGWHYGAAFYGLHSTPEQAAEAIAASLKPAKAVDPARRPDADVIAAVTGFESPV